VAMFIVDRRLTPGSKSLENRQRFLRHAKAPVQGAVEKTSEGRDIDIRSVAPFRSPRANESLATCTGRRLRPNKKPDHAEYACVSTNRKRFNREAISVSRQPKSPSGQRLRFETRRATSGPVPTSDMLRRQAERRNGPIPDRACTTKQAVQY
jgi:hypothetical protein